MATAYIIQNDTPSLPATGPVLYSTNPSALSEVVENSAPASTRGKLLTKQAPTLVPASSSPSGDTGAPKKMSLQDYMNEILAAMVMLQSYAAQLDTAQNNTADSFVQLSIAQANKAKDDYQKYEKAVEAAKHRSWWQKLCGYIVGAVLSIVGAITCNPGLIIAGTLSIVMTATGASDKISQFLQNHIHLLGVRILAEIGIGVAMAVCLCGLSAAMEAGFELALPEAAGAAAESSAEDSGVEMSNLGANGAGENGAAGTAETSNSTNSSQDFLTNVKSKMTKWTFLASFAQSTLVVNPFIDLSAAFIEMINAIAKRKVISDSAKEEASEIAGTILAVAAAFGSVLISSSASESQGLIDVLAEAKGPLAAERFKSFILYPLQYGVRPGFGIAGGVMGVKAGQAQFTQASVLDDLGVTQGAQSILQSMIDMAGAMINQTQDGFKGVADAYSMINNRWENYVAPYITSAEIMG